jgi:ATP-dependent 26S proteasome regulatory subunit
VPVPLVAIFHGRDFCTSTKYTYVPIRPRLDCGSNGTFQSYLSYPAEYIVKFYWFIFYSILFQFQPLFFPRFKLSDDVSLDSLVHHFPSQMSGADIYSICSNAWTRAIRRIITSAPQVKSAPVIVTMDDFLGACSLATAPDKFSQSVAPDNYSLSVAPELLVA